VGGPRTAFAAVSVGPGRLCHMGPWVARELYLRLAKVGALLAVRQQGDENRAEELDRTFLDDPRSPYSVGTGGRT
jgi:hypothetical protein